MRKLCYILLACALLLSCVDRDKRTKESPFYKLLVDKKWAVKVGPFSNAINFYEITQKLTEQKFTIDSINADISKGSVKSDGHFFPFLKFKKDYTIEYGIDTRLILCGNGLMHFKEGKWWLDGNKLYIDVMGSIFPEPSFHYKIEYQVSEIDTNRFNLRKIKDLVWDEKKG